MAQNVLPKTGADQNDPKLQKKLVEAEDHNKVLEEWTQKYGGYNSVSTSHFALVSHVERKKRIVSFVAIPIIRTKELQDAVKLVEYCEKTLGFINVQVIRVEIALNTLLVIDGFPMRIAGKDSGGVNCTANSDVPLILSNSEMGYIKKIEKMLLRKKKDKGYVLNCAYDGISREENTKLYGVLVEKAMTKIYSKRPANQMKYLSSGKELFENLSTEDQCVVLSNVLSYFAMGSGKADLELIGGSKVSGTIRFSSHFDLQKKKLVLVDQSITGLFEKRTQILL